MKKYLLFILNTILIIYGIYLYFHFTNLFSKDFVAICLSVCLFESFIIIFHIRKYLFRPVTVLVFSYLIVNCQLYLDLLFDNISPGHPVFVSPDTINKGALLSALAFTALATGYILTPKYLHNKSVKLFFNKYLYNVFVWGAILSFFLWLFTLTYDDFTGESYLNSGNYDNSRSFYLEVLWQTFMLVAFVYNCIRFNSNLSFRDFLKRIPMKLLLVTLIYMLIKLMSGDRGPVIYTTILLAFLYLFQTKKRISLFIIIPVTVVGLFIMTSISFSRLLGSDIGFIEKLTYIADNREELENINSFSPFTKELANSVGCTHVALDQVYNKQQGYQKGLFHFCYIVKSIPLVGNKFLRDYLGIPRVLQSSSEYVTVVKYGQFYSSGMGTTTIADNFLEFGLIGVIVAFLFIGFIFKKVDTCIIFGIPNKVPASILLGVFVMCYGALYIPRGIFFMYLRTWLYAVIVFTSLRFLIAHKR